MKKFTFWSARLSMIIGLLALVAMLIQGPGYKAGWWDLGTSFFSVFPKVVIGGGIAILLGTIGFLGPKLIGEKLNMLGILGIVLGFSAAIVPISIKQTAGSLPLIHDITTDTINPPQFVSTAKLRTEKMNPASYDSAIAPQQIDAYPDIKTIEINASRNVVLANALKTVESLGWELVDSKPVEGLIEATDTTAWFGFKDDVVIRVVQSGDKTVVDVRSKSRIGKSDLGANAERIRIFRDALVSMNP